MWERVAHLVWIWVGVTYMRHKTTENVNLSQRVGHRDKRHGERLVPGFQSRRLYPLCTLCSVHGERLVDAPSPSIPRTPLVCAHVHCGIRWDSRVCDCTAP